MQALITTLEERDMQVEVTRFLNYDDERRRPEGTPPSNVTRVLVAGEWIGFGLAEKRTLAPNVAPVPPKGLTGQRLESWMAMNQPQPEFVPTGAFELRIKSAEYTGVRALWSDGKRQRIEECLDQFIAQLPIVAGAIKQRREEIELRHQQYLELEAQRLADIRRREEEAKRIGRFEEELRRWRLAKDIREYLREVRELAIPTSAVDLAVVSAEALEWAEAYATRIDPLTALRDRAAEGSAQPPSQSSDDRVHPETVPHRSE